MTFIIDIDTDGYWQIDELEDGKRECLASSKRESKHESLKDVKWSTIRKTMNDMSDKNFKSPIKVHGTSEMIIEALEDLQDSIDSFGYCTVEELAYYFGELDPSKLYGRTYGWTDIDEATVNLASEGIDEYILTMPKETELKITEKDN